MITNTTAAVSFAVAAGLKSSTQIERLNLGELHASATNPRKYFDPEGINEMELSIEEHGVKMPLLARPSKAEPGKYEIVAGERRYRGSLQLVTHLAERQQAEAEGSAEAVRLAALYEARLLLPVIVEDLDDATVLELQLLENLQRRDLRPLEEAQGYQALLDLKMEGDKPAYTPEMIAQKIGRSAATVLNKLKMLKAPESLRKALEEGKVGERHLALVASIPGPKAREACAKAVLRGDWQAPVLSVRDTQALITREYRQSLKKVAWELEDAVLLPEAGACVNCPHFAKKAAEQDAELAAELGNERGQMDPLTCFNPECLGKKNAAAWKLQEARAKQGEVQLLPEAQAKKVFPHGDAISGTAPFIKLDDKPGHDITGHYDTGKTPTWRQILQKQEGVQITMANTVNGPVEIVDKKTAIELAKKHPKHGKLFAHAQASGKRDKTDEEKKEAERRGFEMKVGAAERVHLLTRLRGEFLGKHQGVETSLAVLEAALYEAGLDGNKMLCDFLEIEPEAPKKKGERLDQGAYRACILKALRATGAAKLEVEALIMLAVISKWVKAWGLKISSLEPLLKHFGFTAKDITAEATAEVKAALAEKKAKAKGKVKPVVDSTDPVNVSSKKEASKTAAADKLAKGKSKAAKGSESRVEGEKPLLVSPFCEMPPTLLDDVWKVVQAQLEAATEDQVKIIAGDLGSITFNKRATNWEVGCMTVNEVVHVGSCMSAPKLKKALQWIAVNGIKNRLRVEAAAIGDKVVFREFIGSGQALMFITDLYDHEVPVCLPNDKGVFLRRACFNLDLEPGYLAVELARTDEGTWCWGTEFAFGEHKGGSFPAIVDDMETRAEAVGEAARELLYQLQQAQAFGGGTVAGNVLTAIIQRSKQNADEGIRAPGESVPAPITSTKVEGVPDEVLGFPSMFKVVHTEAAAKALKDGATDLLTLVGPEPDARTAKKAHAVWKNVAGRIRSLAASLRGAQG